jgi:hypothetical protein
METEEGQKGGGGQTLPSERSKRDDYFDKEKEGKVFDNL